MKRLYYIVYTLAKKEQNVKMSPVHCRNDQVYNVEITYLVEEPKNNEQYYKRDQ